jgi:thioredoxin
VSDNIVHTNDSSFEADVLNSDKPALVDFWAEWCGPCKMIAPILEEAASEYVDKMSVVKLNVDESPNIAHAIQGRCRTGTKTGCDVEIAANGISGH